MMWILRARKELAVLRCVAKACIDYGQRVQNSVFECEVTEAQYCLLRGRIKDIIDMSRDSVRFYIS